MLNLAHLLSIPMFDRRHVALGGNNSAGNCISLSMNSLDITYLDRTSEGIVVTFGDGNTFLFPTDFLFGARLKDGQLIQPPKSDAELKLD